MEGVSFYIARISYSVASPVFITIGVEISVSIHAKFLLTGSGDSVNGVHHRVGRNKHLRKSLKCNARWKWPQRYLESAVGRIWKWEKH